MFNFFLWPGLGSIGFLFLPFLVTETTSDYLKLLQKNISCQKLKRKTKATEILILSTMD